MTTAMTKTELTEKVGKKFLLADNYTLSAKLNYVSGIQSFDKYIDGKTLKQISAVIHLTKYPKGLVITIAKLFSSFPFGLADSEIKRTFLAIKSGTSNLIFETSDNGKIIFSLKTSHVFDVKQFLNDIHLKYDFETNISDTKQSMETKTVFNSKYRKR
jgi:hypothetical protein